MRDFECFFQLFNFGETDRVESVYRASMDFSGNGVAGGHRIICKLVLSNAKRRHGDRSESPAIFLVACFSRRYSPKRHVISHGF